MTDYSSPVAAELRTPQSAAIAGLIFSGILVAVLVLMHRSVPAGVDVPDWAEDASQRRAVSGAIALIPFAGISFLWFIGVIRTRLGAREDKLFATVFLGSGLLFVGLLFTTAAFLSTLLALYDQGIPVRSDAMVALQELTQQLMSSYGARMAAVFTISVSSVGLRTRLIPRWLVGFGFLAGLALLAQPPLWNWTQLVFPLWVMLLSVTILVMSRREGQAVAG